MKKAKKISQANKPQKSLDELLANHPDLRVKMIEALETDHFFITISCQLRRKPHDPHDLQHFIKPHNYPVIDTTLTLRHLFNDFTAKNNPTARLSDDKGGIY